MMRVSIAVIALTVLFASGLRAQDTTVYKTTDEGVSLPQVVKQVRPQYTSEAMHQMIEGEALLDVVVKSDGKVGDVSVKESLDAVYGLDQEAIKAVKQWEFKPGTKDGKAVNVRVDVKMRFTLR
jgi:protein TonB